MFNKPTIIMKQFKNLILAGALVLGLAGFAVSCDKYGDDIDSLQTQVDAIKADLQALQAKVDGGKYVTNVVKSGDGIVITWNDNSTSTIETIKGDKGDKGEDGKAGTVVTIVDGYWAFDGVKSEYPAVGPKGEDGVDGTNGADGHDAKVSEDGYWMVWDAEAGEYVKTAYIAGGVRAVETTGGYNLTVRDEDGVEQTIFVPTCPILVGIQDVKDRVRPLDIFYGVVNQAVDWDGAKGGAEKKMQAGMYPVLEEDVQVVLNPTGVDATAYRFDFRASDNKELWGLTFNDMVPYDGDTLLTVPARTRAVSSESGIWVLPREVARVELNELNARADYVTQFKKNDGSLYAFALNATSKTDASQVIKSQYIYSFDPKNIGVPGKDFIWIDASGFDPNRGIRHNYVWNEYHTPDFKDWHYSKATGSVYDIIGNVKLDQVIYDYKIEIDRTKMTQVNIDKYGLEISEDGYYFRTTKEASINNYVDLKISYILINGTKDTKDYRVYITAKDLVVTDTNIGTINEAFNAVHFTPNPTKISDLSGKYVLGAKELAFNPKEVLGANYDEWVDAMFNLLYNQTDADKATNLKAGVSILGGDPINNDATYNDLLVKNFLYIDYVDASGRSCIYGVAKDKVLSRLADIAALKVYFIAGTYHPSAADPYVGNITNAANNSDNVKAPFYTVSGTTSWSGGFAIPLDNAFSVEVATSKEEYEVAAFTFKFQLTQPDIEKVGIVRKEGEFTTWTTNANRTADVLAVYGAYNNTEMRLPMYEAFDMWIGTAPAIYTLKNPNAKWFELTMATTPNTALFEDNTSNVYKGTLNNIEYEVNWKDYETYMKAAFVPNDCPQVVVDVNYHFFGVYPALPTQLPFYTDANGDAHPGFLLQYTSTIAKSSMETKETIYNAHAGTHYVFISNDDIVAKTEKGREFVLFDGLDAKSNVTTRAKLNDARGFNEDIRPFDAPMDYEISAIRVGDKQPVTVKSNITDKTGAGMPWIVDASTSSIEPDVPAPAADGEIQVYLFPSSKNYPVGDASYPLGLPAVEGGFVIQLGQYIDYRQPIEVTIKVKDELGYSQNLKVVVQKLED